MKVDINKVLYLDIETDPDGNFLMGCFNNGKFFYSVKALYEYIRDYEGVIFAHNGGSFDFLYILDTLQREGCKDRFVVERVGSRALRIRVNNCILQDTIFLMPLSLDRLAEEFGMKKAEIDYDNILLLPIDEVRDACIQHAKILKDVHLKFFDFFGVPRYSVSTIGALSHYILKVHYGMDNNIKNDDYYNNFFRKYYFGGRNEIVKMKAEDVYVYDVNSAYPYAMQNVVAYSDYVFTKRDRGEKDFIGAILRVNMNRYIPVTYIRSKNGIYFVNGKYELFLYASEFGLLSDNEIEKVKVYIYGDGRKYCFGEFVDYYYKMKETSQNSVLYKLLLNSAYGKFAQREGGDLVVNGAYIKKGGAYRYENVCYAGQITSYVRMLLYRYIQEQGDNNIVYYDTDSIFGKKEMEYGGGIGKLKFEGKFDKFSAIQCKMYELKGERTKIRMRGIKNPDEEKFKLLSLGQKVEYVNYTKIGNVLRGKEMKKNIETKRLFKKYDKRKIIDGVNTEPYDYKEIIYQGNQLSLL